MKSYNTCPLCKFSTEFVKIIIQNKLYKPKSLEICHKEFCKDEKCKHYYEFITRTV